MESEPEIILILASDFRQACMAADQLGLPPPDGHRHGDRVVVFVDRPHRLRGFMPHRVVFVEPRLERTIVDRVLHDDARQAARTRLGGAVKIEYVTT